MKGQPKYKVGDKVQFILEDKLYHGIVYIVDEYGTWDNDSDVSYDIMINDYGENHDKECLVKHVTEKLVQIYKKTFAELKAGDYMYYWDHGKLHSQLILDVENKEEIENFTDWFGNKCSRTINYATIVTEHKTYKFTDWYLKQSSEIYRGMRRFASKEAVNDYICNRVMYINSKVLQAKKMLDKYTKLKNKYTETAYNLTL